MEDLNSHLISLADKLDKDGKLVCSNVLDDLIQNNSLNKVAQYVGVIGYVLKQNRAMGNCVRKKRASSDRAMQEIVMECLKEYQDGQSYQDTEWHSKYAQSIINRPDDIHKSHIELITNFSQQQNIEEHINRVQKTASILEQNDVYDETINKVLSHINILADILRKDSVNPRSFKLAAPPSPRGRWSRLWTPNQFSWSNPMSWRGRWQRGEDKDTKTEMDEVLRHMQGVSLLTQKIRDTIANLQNQVASQDFTNPETKQLIGLISPQIQLLDPANWRKNVVATQNMIHLLSTSKIKESKIKESKIKDLIYGLNHNNKLVDDHIKNIQLNMSTLRQRNVIKGRNSGVLDDGEPNPLAMSSPAQEFGVLEQVLNRLYNNPLDDKSQHYAKTMHARLDDKLRHITLPQDEESKQWLSKEQENYVPTFSNNTDSSIPDNSTPTPTTPSTNNIDIKKIVEQLKDIENINDKKSIASAVLNIIGRHFNIDNNTISNIISSLSSETDSTSLPKTDSPLLDTSTKPQTTDLPVNDWTEFINTPTTPTKDTPTEGNPSVQLPPPGKSANIIHINQLVKIADEIDKKNPELSDIIDAYIEEHKDETLLIFPQFPSMGKIIKEDNPTKLLNNKGIQV